MSAVARKAAKIVGAVASVAAMIPGPWQPIAAGVAAAAAITSAVLAKKPRSSVGGDQTRFTANKDQGLPYAMGRTAVSGFIAHRATSGEKNIYQTFFTVLSAGGPVHSIDETILIDGKAVSFGPNGGALGPDYAEFMWRDLQLGFAPEGKYLQSSTGAVPGWGPSCKLSGYAAYSLTLKFDEKGKVFAAGVPEPSVVLHGVRAYDPRQDSTYPGGSGPHRAYDETTWTYTDNAFLHGLTWLIGRHQNGKRVLGVGAPLDGIDVPAYVEACNIAVANGWTMGGAVYSTDEKWAALKAILQSGGGEPCRMGAIISCVVKAPRVSLDTIRSSDIVGEASVTGTQRRRERINAIVPRYRSEAHNWEMVPAAVVKVDAYATEDGGRRTREVEYPLVQDAKLAAQLAAYDIVDAREFGPIVLPLKTRWVGYKPGDCLTIDVPELNMVGQMAIVLNRSLDPSTGVVTLTLRSETAAKHDFALGRTANPPPTPSLQVIDPSQLLVPGVSAVWAEVTGDGKPEDGADVTGNHTSADSRKLGGIDAEEITRRIKAAQDTADGIVTDIDGKISATEEKLREEAAAGLALVDGEVDAVRARIRQGSPNLLPGGDFYDGLNGWSQTGTGWNVVRGTFRGTFVGNFGGGTDAQLFRDIPAAAGTPYSLSAEMDFADGADAGNVFTQFLTSGGQVVGPGPSISGTGWGRVTSDPVVAPAGTVKIRVLLARRKVGGPVLFNRIQIQEGEATDFQPWANLGEVAAGVRETKEAIAGTQSAFAQYRIEVDAAVDGAEAKADDAIKAAADADTAAVQRTNRLSAFLRTVGNRAIGSDFREGFKGWAVIGDWVTASSTDFGTYASPTGGSLRILLQDITVAPGQPWSFGADGGGGGINFYAQWLNAGGGQVEADFGHMPINGVTRAGPFIAPAGAARLRFLVNSEPANNAPKSVTRVMVNPGDPAAWNSEADDRELGATVTRQEGALVEIGGKTQSYAKTTVRAGGAGADLTLFAIDENGVLHSGAVLNGDFYLNGNLFLADTIHNRALFRPDFYQQVIDTDTTTYSRDTYGTVDCSGLVAVLNNSPVGVIRALIEADYAWEGRGDGNQTTLYNSDLYLRIRGADGVNHDYQVDRQGLFDNPNRHRLSVALPINWFQEGGTTITAYVLQADTNTPPTSGTPADPGSPGARSAKLFVSNLTLRAEWQYFGSAF